jgi:glycosyltransferase involved in cell wall biosynthesis
VKFSPAPIASKNHELYDPFGLHIMKIYLCTTASSKQYKSWSNIPYLLHKNLEKRGYTVKNYVMREMEPLKTVFNLPIRFLNRFFKLGTTYYFVRTPFHFFCTYLYSCWIGLISNRQDVMIVQGFSYPPRNRKNRQIILGDWPSEYLFEKMLNRQPSRLERKSIERENTVIEAADAVVTLFPNVREYMLGKYKNQNIYHFGNVVNVDDDVVRPQDIHQIKILSTRLLFVGQHFYLSGALELVAAVRNLREAGIDCQVDIVGIEPELINAEYDWLSVHGYLDKERIEDKLKYYELLSKAHLFVNTTRGWSGFQAILEAMYFSNPIVVRLNEGLQGYFTNLRDLAYLVEDDGLSLEQAILNSFMDRDAYQSKSKASRHAVESSTWSHFVENVILLTR